MLESTANRRAKPRRHGYGRVVLRAALVLAALLFVLAPAFPQDKGGHGTPAEQEAGAPKGGEDHMSTLMAWKAFLVQVFGFGLLVFGFTKLVWPALAKSLGKQGAELDAVYRRLETSKLDAERERKDFEARIASLADEEKSRIAAAVAEGQRIRDEMIREAGEQAARIVEKAKREIQVARDAALIEVSETLIQQAMEAASARLLKEVDVKMHHQLASAFINDLDKARGFLGKGGEA